MMTPTEAKVKASGNRRDLDDLDVGSPGNLGEKKRSGSHDGRHELTSGGGCGFDSAGKVCGIAHALHERDRIDTVHHDVGHGASRDGAEKGAGDDRSQPRSAGPPSGDRVGQVDKDLSAPGDFHEGAQDHEDQDVGGKNIREASQNPVTRQKKTFGDPGQGETRVAQPQREIGAEVGVDEEKDPDAGDDVSHGSPGHFQREEDDEPSENGIDRPDRSPHPVGKVGKFDDVVNDHDAHSENE